VVATWRSAANLRSWLPGTRDVEDVVVVPADVPPTRYNLDVAILSEDGESAYLELGIAGKRADKWYPISNVTINSIH
jgi:hypothetical protein